MPEARPGLGVPGGRVLPIVLHPDPRLRAVCAPVGAVTDEVRCLAADMLATMYAAPGRGLAAPQVGVLSRLFVVDVSWKEGAPAPMAFVDPVVEAAGAPEAGVEGCLSIPDRPVEVVRPGAVRVSWTDLDGARREGRFEGAMARCIQHEADHLDGVLILDREGAPAEGGAAP